MLVNCNCLPFETQQEMSVMTTLFFGYKNLCKNIVIQPDILLSGAYKKLVVNKAITKEECPLIDFVI